MSLTYYIIQDLIKEEYKKHYQFKGKNTIQIIGYSSLFLFFVSFLSLLYSINWISLLILLISLGLLIISIYLLYRLANKVKKNPSELIDKIEIRFIEENLKSLSLLTNLISEVSNEIEILKNKRNVLYKRISVIFASVFWIPSLYLVKLYFNSGGSELTGNNVVIISVYLLLFAIYIIGIIIGIGPTVDEVMMLGSSNYRMVLRYLKDLQYRWVIEHNE